MEKVAIEDNNNSNKAKALNYYKSSIKCSIFNRLSSFKTFNFAAINYYGEKEDINYNDQKILFVPSNKAIVPFFMMGIRLTNDLETQNKYIATTLFASTNPKEYFENQEVIIPTQILVNNNNNLTKTVATPKEKLQLLTMYESIINKYNLENRINIYGDYMSTLNDATNCKIKRLNNNQ